jgi:hypothetical protein
MAIIYTYPIVSSVAQGDKVLLSKASDNSTAQATLEVLKDGLGVIDTITATSPIQVSLGNHSAALSLTTVPTSLGGTGLTTIGNAGQFLVVNSAGNGLEYIDETFIDGSGTANYLPIFTDSDTLGDSTMYQSGSGDLVIKQYIQHDGDTGSKFGFNIDDGFIVYLGGTGATERLQLQPDSFLVRTGDSTKISTNATNASLYYEPSTSTDSHIVLTSTIDGALLKGEVNVNPGKLRLYNIAQNSYAGFRGSTDPLASTYTLQMPAAVGTIGQVLKLGTPGPTTELEWGDGLPDQSGQAGNFLKTDGTTATWASAAGGGTITGSGASNQVAFFSGASAIDGDDSLKFNLGQLTVGDESSNTAGKIIIENDPNVKGGTIRLVGKANSGIANKYVILNASESIGATAYNIYFPPTVPSSNNQVLKSVGQTGELQWADDNTNSIGGTIALNEIPLGTATDTIGASIMEQQSDTRIRISSPENAGTGSNKFPSLQMYNGSTARTWAFNEKIAEYQVYSADQSTEPGAHVCGFMNLVYGKNSAAGTAVSGKWSFGTSQYNTTASALESLAITEIGNVEINQVSTSGNVAYRAGNLSLQNTGELQFFQGAFDNVNGDRNIPGCAVKYNNSSARMEVGSFDDGSVGFSVYTDAGTLALDIDDNQESTFSGAVTLSSGNLTVSSGDVTVSSGDVTVSSGSVVASPNGDFKTSGGGFLGGNGTAGKPTFTFDSDSDTGLYRFGSNILGITAGGAQIAKVQSTGLTMASGKQITLASNSTDSQLVIANQVPNSNTTQKSITWSALAASQQFAEFIYQPVGGSPSVIGSIQMSGVVGTLYASGSDYRLKENIVSLTGALDKVKQLKPKTYNFLSDPDKESVDGFIAHEAQEVVPNSVAGEKDKIDENGDAVYQMMDPAKLIPILTGAIQELTARIEALEAK